MLSRSKHKVRANSHMLISVIAFSLHSNGIILPEIRYVKNVKPGRTLEIWRFHYAGGLANASII